MVSFPLLFLSVALVVLVTDIVWGFTVLFVIIKKNIVKENKLIHIYFTHIYTVSNQKIFTLLVISNEEKHKRTDYHFTGEWMSHHVGYSITTINTK